MVRRFLAPRSPLVRLGTLVAVAGLGGCEAPRGPVSIDSDDPDLKVQAIERNVSLHDDRDDSKLVDALNDDDPAVRFYAIQALRRLTGNDFGYHYWDDETARAPAVARWRSWARAHAGR